jgi:hypothetical protein
VGSGMDPEVSHIPEPGKDTKIIASSDDHRILREKEVLRLLAQGHSYEDLPISCVSAQG